MSSPNPARKRLPVKPSEENLRKQAKRRAKIEQLQLAEAQHQIAIEYGCRNGGELMHIVETMNRGAGQLSNVKYEMEALPKAANKSDIETVRAILASGEFTQHDLDLALARSVLSYEKRGEIARLLIEHGADPDGQYGSDYGPIIFVTGESLDPEGLQFLIDHGADVTFPPIDTKYGRQCPLSYFLGTYARGQNERKHRGIEILLKHGAFVPPEVSPPILAIHRGVHAELAEMLDKDPSLVSKRFADMPYGNIELRGATLLHCAVEMGEVECVEELIKHGADINARAEVIDGVGGQTPVFHAINTNLDGNFPMLQHLVKTLGERIDMSVRATWRGSAGWAIRDFDPTKQPMSPLEYAEKAARDTDPKDMRHWPKKKEELVLLRDLNRRVFHAAVRAGDVEKSRRMIEAGASPREGGSDSVTALHLAARHGPVGMVELLIRSGAKEWQADRFGKTALDYARDDVAADKDEIITLLDRPVIRDPVFKLAVEAIHAGDLAVLKQLLRDHRTLVHDRVIEPSCYPRSYFSNPKLLWFVADNPNLIPTMPANSVELAEAIIDAGAEQADLDYTLGLVMTSTPAQKQGLQRPLMRLLLSRGAKADRSIIEGAMGHGEKDAIQELINAGEPMTPMIAAGMGRVEELKALLQASDQKELQAALSMAVINFEVECARECLKAGGDPNEFLRVHSHSTPMHHAAGNDDVPMLELLLEYGAKHDVNDTLWNATPLGWAVYNKRAKAEALLRSKGYTVSRV